MSKTTTVNAIPYPEDSDAPDAPTQIKALATLLDTLKWGSRNLAPTIGLKAAESDLALSASFEDVPLSGGSLELTPAVESKLLIAAVFDLEASPSSTGAIIRARGTIRLDAADQTREARVSAQLGDRIDETAGEVTNLNNVLRATVPQFYLLTLSAAKHTIKMRARRETSPEGKCYAANTGFAYLLVAA
jgi:hypothetical protein